MNTWAPLDPATSRISNHFVQSGLKGNGFIDRFLLFIDERKKSLLATVTFLRPSEGHTGVIHGGAISSILDDVMGTLYNEMK